MSLKSGTKLTRTVVFRLTVAFTMLFMLLLAVVFFSSYGILKANLTQRIDDFLLIESQELEKEFEEEGIEEAHEEIVEEGLDEGVSRVFLRLLTSDMNIRNRRPSRCWECLASA